MPPHVEKAQPWKLPAEQHASMNPEIPLHPALADSQAHAEAICVKRAPDAYLPPGKGDRQKLTRLSRLQRGLNGWVKLENGLAFPYVPEDTFDYIEEVRDDVYADFVWDYLGVPKPNRIYDQSNPMYREYLKVFEEFALGRHILKDEVILRRPEGPDAKLSVRRWHEASGQFRRMPDPRFYE